MYQSPYQSLNQILRWRALHQPGRRAYTYLVDGEMEEVHPTYGELDRQARAIGAWLQSIGAGWTRLMTER